KEVVFSEREGQLLGPPTEQLQELLVRQDVPIAPDDRDVGAPLLFRRNWRWLGQPHPLSGLSDLSARGSNDTRQAIPRHQAPIPPHIRMQPVRKMTELKC